MEANEERILSVQNLTPGLVERGKIKIGQKGRFVQSRSGKKFQLPEKLDHFIVTGMLRNSETNNFERDEQLHKSIGETPTEIPIRLLYNDIELNFQTRYSCYRGTTLLCYGDGVKAFPLRQEKRVQTTCPCGHQDPKYTGPDKCKINGTLSCIIDGAEIVGGVWKLRTTSYNSVIGILSSLALIKRISGGQLAGLPLMLTLQPKTVTNPVDAKLQTIYVIGIEFRGSVMQLQKKGYDLALNDAHHQIKVERIEDEAKRLLTADAGQLVESTDDLEEFYPDNAAGGAETIEPGESETPDLTAPGPEAPKDETPAEPEKKAAPKKKAEPKNQTEPTAPAEPDPPAAEEPEESPELSEPGGEPETTQPDPEPKTDKKGRPSLF